MNTEQWVLIENKGEIAPNALILMGGSTKRGDNGKIGLYGSGNKYTIALFLKHGIKFRIFSGEHEIEITTKEVGFRDKQFQQILINGQETSLTTDMGPQWDTWMGIRELVSNSIDESESNIVESVEEIRPREGYTRIYVEHHPDIKTVLNEWNKFFSFDRTDAMVDIDGQRIYPQIPVTNEGLLLYRKGIQAYYMKAQKALYSYDLPHYKINESRVVENTYEARNQSCEFLCKHATKQIATNILSNAFKEEGYWEGGMDWWWYHSYTLNNAWREAIGDRIIVNIDATGFYLKEMAENKFYIVSKSLAKTIRASFDDVQVYGIGQDSSEGVNWRELEQTPKIQYMLKRAMEFCEEIQYQVGYPIQIVEFDKPEVMGLAHNKHIYIAATTFDKGMKEVVMTLMEENEHIKTELHDKTRDWANHWIRMYLTSKEEQHGIFL